MAGDSARHRHRVQDFYDRHERGIEEGGRPDQPTQRSVFLETEAPDPARLANLYLARRAGIGGREHILEAGCGSGGPMIDIARAYPGVRFTGVNLSPVQVRRARERVAQAGLSQRIEVVEGDFHALPFDDGSFDRILFLESIFLSDDPGRAFAEAWRVLRPGGAIYLEDMFRHPGCAGAAAQSALTAYEKRSGGPVPKAEAIVAQLRSAGFGEIRFEDISHHLQRRLFRETVGPLPVFWADLRAKKAPLPLRVPPGGKRAAEPVGASGGSRAGSLIYALGVLGYDLGTEARRDSFKQLMPPAVIDGAAVPANPYDARQMADYLESNLSEGRSLIWTLNLELSPIYAIEPVGPFARDVYAVLHQMLDGQIRPEDQEGYIERVSLPGRLTGRTVRLFSGQILPVVKIGNVRGMYGWNVNALRDSAIAAVRADNPEATEQAARRSLRSFLNRIYYELRNLGHTSQERALNFAATNAFQLATAFSEAVGAGLELDSVEVHRSPFCRMDSDCWDVILAFFDADNILRARKVYRFTIDVSDTVPVTLGEIRSWSSRSPVQRQLYFLDP